MTRRRERHKQPYRLLLALFATPFLSTQTCPKQKSRGNPTPSTLLRRKRDRSETTRRPRGGHDREKRRASDQKRREGAPRGTCPEHAEVEPVKGLVDELAKGLVPDATNAELNKEDLANPSKDEDSRAPAGERASAQSPVEVDEGQSTRRPRDQAWWARVRPYSRERTAINGRAGSLPRSPPRLRPWSPEFFEAAANSKFRPRALRRPRVLRRREV